MQVFYKRGTTLCFNNMHVFGHNTHVFAFDVVFGHKSSEKLNQTTHQIVNEFFYSISYNVMEHHQQYDEKSPPNIMRLFKVWLFVKQHEIENIVANQGNESMKKNFENL